MEKQLKSNRAAAHSAKTPSRRKPAPRDPRRAYSHSESVGLTVGVSTLSARRRRHHLTIASGS